MTPPYLMHFRRTAAIIMLLTLVSPLQTSAAGGLSDALRAVTVRVVCGDRQGSGVLTAAGYVLTVGHVPIDPDTGAVADHCRVGFISGAGSEPDSFYRADVVHAVLSDKYDLDLGVVRLGQRLYGPPVSPAPAPVELFAEVGDPLTVAGYPGSENGIASSEGTITAYSRGTISSDAVIAQGYSGGPAFDANGSVLGIASRITYLIDPDTGQESDFTYVLGDMATMVSWLEAFGDVPATEYLTYADPERVSALPYFIRDEEPGCLDVVRTSDSPAVYCLLTEDRRFVFPNASVFGSWYPDFSSVQWVRTEDIAKYRLIGNMTYKAGTLVKIVTDPKVYLVTDTFGTLRPIPDEARARELFGDDWASRVRDVPDAFFIDYSVGKAL